MSEFESPGEELSALIDGTLAEPRASELRDLLARDAALRAEYERLRGAVEALRALPAVRAPEALRSRVFRRRRRLFRWSVPVAAALLLAALLWWRDDAPVRPQQRALAPEPDPPPPAAAADASASSPRRSVELGEPLADAGQRAAYLAALADLDASALREHILAAGDRHAAPQAELRLTVADADEAGAIRALLERAFPPPPAAFGLRPEGGSPLVFAIDPGGASADSVRAWVGLLDTGPKVRGKLASAKANAEGSGEAPRAPLTITLVFPER